MKKQIKNNTLTIQNGVITYTTYDGFTATKGVSEYDSNGDHQILEAIHNLAPNNTIAHELVQKFNNWLKQQAGEQPKPITNNPYSLHNFHSKVR